MNAIHPVCTQLETMHLNANMCTNIYRLYLVWVAVEMVKISDQQMIVLIYVMCVWLFKHDFIGRTGMMMWSNRQFVCSLDDADAALHMQVSLHFDYAHDFDVQKIVTFRFPFFFIFSQTIEYFKQYTRFVFN